MQHVIALLIFLAIGAVVYRHIKNRPETKRPDVPPEDTIDYPPRGSRD